VKHADFNRAERALFRTLRTPEKIQRFLDTRIAYDKEPDGPRCRSPRGVRLPTCDRWFQDGRKITSATIRPAVSPSMRCWSLPAGPR